MAKRTSHSRQLELPVLVDIQPKSGVVSGEPRADPNASLSSTKSVLGSAVKCADPQDLLIYEAISANYVVGSR